MRVLGIDPGTAITGYGVVEERAGELSLVECGVIRTSPDAGLPARLKEIYQAVQGLIARSAPAAVAIEALFFNTNVRTAFAVGQARGVCLLAAAQAHLPVYEYTPLQVKQAVVGYGRAEKQQIQEMVRLMLRLEDIPRPDDAADAVAIAICHHHMWRMQALTDAALHETE
ncbi:MAG: crossover junction endodeoxyribonuclease RuvC [Anaerolineae bacterium]|nr:crossover junction endodeoxyribonuclease RuvC [Anaerolineae bacterium]